MRKILVFLAILAMALSVSGATCMNSIINSAPVDFVCKPTPAQQQTATQMLAAIDAAQAVASAFYPATGIFKASAVLTTIKNGGCFLVAELKDAFAAVDAANTAVAKVQVKILKGSVSLTLPEYAPLRKFIK